MKLIFRDVATHQKVIIDKNRD
ncbi:hypothetical protein HKBW3C_02722, partial [Candidatus Hakubella thermalkaliphila]